MICLRNACRRKVRVCVWFISLRSRLSVTVRRGWVRRRLILVWCWVVGCRLLFSILVIVCVLLCLILR